MASSSPTPSHTPFPKRFKNTETTPVDTYDATTAPHTRPPSADSFNNAPGVPVSSLVHSPPDWNNVNNTNVNVFDASRTPPAATGMLMRPPAPTRLDLIAAPPPLTPGFKTSPDVPFTMASGLNYSPGPSDNHSHLGGGHAFQTPARTNYSPNPGVYGSSFRPGAQHKARKSLSGHPYATPLRFSATSCGVRPAHGSSRQVLYPGGGAAYSGGHIHSSPYAHSMSPPSSSPEHILLGTPHDHTGLVTPPGSESPPASLASSLPDSPAVDTVARFEHEATRLEREAAKRGYTMQLVPMVGTEGIDGGGAGGVKERGVPRRASFATLLSEQATRAEPRSQGPGEWTTAKRMIFIDRLITAGYRSLDLAALGAELGLKKKQLVNQLTPGRKGSIRELCLASAAREVELCRGCTKTLDEAKVRAVSAMQTKNLSLSAILEEHPHTLRGARRSHSAATDDDGDGDDAMSEE